MFELRALLISTVCLMTPYLTGTSTARRPSTLPPFSVESQTPSEVQSESSGSDVCRTGLCERVSNRVGGPGLAPRVKQLSDALGDCGTACESRPSQESASEYRMAPSGGPDPGREVAKVKH
jgi:hypothetical protein